MITDLTGMELANASLLDESTSAAEAMALLFAVRAKTQVKAGTVKFFVSDAVLPQTLSVLKTRATPIGIELGFRKLLTVLIFQMIFLVRSFNIQENRG